SSTRRQSAHSATGGAKCFRNSSTRSSLSSHSFSASRRLAHLRPFSQAKKMPKPSRGSKDDEPSVPRSKDLKSALQELKKLQKKHQKEQVALSPLPSSFTAFLSS